MTIKFFIKNKKDNPGFTWKNFLIRGTGWIFHSIAKVNKGVYFTLFLSLSVQSARTFKTSLNHHLTMKFCIYPQDAFRTRLWISFFTFFVGEGGLKLVIAKKNDPGT